MGGGQTNACFSGKWIAGILEEECRALEQCRRQLETKERKPYVIAEKWFGSGGKKESGLEVKPDPTCTPTGGYFGESWFSSASNRNDAKGCAEKLRQLGYTAEVQAVHRSVIADAARVVVK